MSTELAIFDFVEDTEESLSQQIAEFEAAKTSKSQWIKFKVPHTKIRLLPHRGSWGMKSAIHRAREHYVDAAAGFNLDGESKSFSFECPESTGAGHCPICALGRSGVELDEITARMVRVQDRFYANVLNVDELDKGAFRAALPKSVYEMLLTMAQAKGASILSHPKDGVVFQVRRTGTGPKDTRYTVVDLRPHPLTQEELVALDLESPCKFPRQLTGDMRAAIEMTVVSLYNVDVSADGRSQSRSRRAIGAGSVRGQSRQVNHDDTY
jgi:hypothetical protein